jgi:hypothetical protein
MINKVIGFKEYNLIMKYQLLLWRESMNTIINKFPYIGSSPSPFSLSPSFLKKMVGISSDHLGLLPISLASYCALI